MVGIFSENDSMFVNQWITQIGLQLIKNLRSSDLSKIHTKPQGLGSIREFSWV